MKQAFGTEKHDVCGRTMAGHPVNVPLLKIFCGATPATKTIIGQGLSMGSGARKNNFGYPNAQIWGLPAIPHLLGFVYPFTIGLTVLRLARLTVSLILVKFGKRFPLAAFGAFP